MRRTILKIHRWLAIPFGIIISMLCFTGAIILFRKELMPVINFLFGEDNSFMSYVMRMHGSLLIPHDNGFSTGGIIIGISAIAMTVILVTGIILWWPHNIGNLKRRLSVHVNRGFRHFVYDSHVSLGIYSVMFLLLMSLTGPSWSFKWYKDAAVSGVSVFTQQEDDNDTHMIRKRHRGYSPESKVLFSLHTGSWDGDEVRVLYLASAIIGGFLPISGYYMWYRKRRSKRLTGKNKQDN